MGLLKDWLERIREEQEIREILERRKAEQKELDQKTILEKEKLKFLLE